MKGRSWEVRLAAIVLCNFLVAFGTVLGKWEHFNSCVVFTAPGNVVLSALRIFTSVHLLELTVFYFAVCNGIYFLFRSTLLRYARNVW